MESTQSNKFKPSGLVKYIGDRLEAYWGMGLPRPSVLIVMDSNDRVEKSSCVKRFKICMQS